MGDFFEAAGSISGAYDACDWAASPLGAPETWSSALHSAVRQMLRSRFPMTLLWGPEFVLVYNEAYVPLVADKHPAALGTPAREVFPEAWDIIGPMMQDVMADPAGSASTWTEDALVPLDRRGFLEDCYFTFAYSPVVGADGVVEGVLDVTVETTRHVVSERRLDLLGQLGAALAGVEDVAEMVGLAMPLLTARVEDLAVVELRLAGAGASYPSVQRLPARPPEPVGRRDLVLQESDGRSVAWLPLRPAAEAFGVDDGPMLVVELSPRLPVDRAYLVFLRLLADILSQALDRVEVRAAEQLVFASERSMSEALQRSLLTRPWQPDHLQVGVRYQPAAEVAQIGGDWHDSFLLPGGALALAIGDVSGHDREAAAAMGQLRNLLRGIAYAIEDSPAGVLSGLDRAMQGLEVGTFASVVFARLEQTEDQAEQGLRTLRWSNAGHPPPLLIEPDGSTRLLESHPELLLGVDAQFSRADHTATLHPGSSVVFYTDGLIERRGTSIDDGLAWLIDVAFGQQHLDAEQLCDLLLEHAPGAVEDDIALLVVHAYDESRTRSAAGRQRVPAAAIP